jgi:hypothetical protein
MNTATFRRSSPRWLALAGGALLLAAIAWWALVFLRVLANGYLSTREALTCSVASSIICDLATSLCGKTHPLGITWYSPEALWIAVALLSAAGLLTREGT